MLAQPSTRDQMGHSAPWVGSSITARLLAGAIALTLALQFCLALFRQINWDEFLYLSQVHDFARGDLTLAVQTFHVHFFQWLTWLPLEEIGQIVVARLVMLAFEGVSAWMLYRLARPFVTAEAALMGVLAFISFSFVVVHGASFRTDPLATALMMTATALLAAAPLGRVAAVGVGFLTALAALVTIKVVFYVPLLAALAVWQLRAPGRRAQVLLSLLIAGGTGVVALLLLYGLHTLSLAPADVNSSLATVSGGYNKTMGSSGLLPRRDYLLPALAQNPVHWLLLVLGVATLVRARATAPALPRAVGLAFLMPLATLLFYRNAFPYFYAFMLAPAGLVMALAATRLQGTRWFAYVAAFMVAGAVGHTAAALRADQQGQRAITRTVHAMLPTPVAYIDRCSMLATFPKVGFFMSSWGIEAYRDAGRPVLHEAIVAHQPALLIINSPALEAAVSTARRPMPSLLLAADARALRDTYIPHWGPIWIAGKTLRLDSRPQTFTLPIAGRYTVEAPQDIIVDGVRRPAGAVIALTRGRHVIRTSDGQATVTLRWGDHLYRPAAPPPASGVFQGF